MIVARTRLLIAMLWVGSLWTVGYLVAPTLFATLNDRHLAGSIAGSMFHVEAWLSVACAVILILLQRFKDAAQPKYWLRLIYGMLACTLIGYFGLHPFMAALREAADSDGVMTAHAEMQFGMLHGVSSLLYLIESVLGIALVLKA